MGCGVWGKERWGRVGRGGGWGGESRCAFFPNKSVCRHPTPHTLHPTPYTPHPTP
ncbi:MAG: hypothetical protein F6J93_16590 [Oscillatoria sp. SIO1A7]|nr:hypothetical protein [Oscillatoria sp. SIO1A7]